MTHTAKAIETRITAKERLIVALDVATAGDARRIVAETEGSVGAFKIGLQLFVSAGPDFVREMVGNGSRIFLDLKFHDIPNTVAMAAVEAARLGVWMVNIHASGGGEMMGRTRDAVDNVCEKEQLKRPKLIGVTVLTSSDAATLDEVGVRESTDSNVVRLAKLSSASELDGVVASPREIALIRNALADKTFLIVTPGIRPIDATKDDQMRVMTFGQAIANGADYVVVGRPITQADNMLEAVKNLIAEVDV